MTPREALRLSPLYHRLRPVAERVELALWVRRGRPAPAPHLVKSRTVAEYARRFGRRVLVETGTYLGAMVVDTRHVFDKIYSIELDPRLNAHARRLFASDPGVDLRLGDSALLLPELLRELDGPALFWLDAHDSGGLTARGRLETPVREELKLILTAAVDPVVLVDDAHLFTGRNDYPTLDEVAATASKLRPGFVLQVGDNIVRLHRADA